MTDGGEHSSNGCLKHSKVGFEFTFNEKYTTTLLNELLKDGYQEELQDGKFQLLRWKDVAFGVRSRLG